MTMDGGIWAIMADNDTQRNRWEMPIKSDF